MVSLWSLERRGTGTALALLVGLTAIVAAVCAGWVSRADWRPGAVLIPWGLLLGVAGALAVGWIARMVGRMHVAVATGGWVLGVAMWLLRPGEAVIAADARGYAFLLAPTAALLGLLAWGRASP